MKKNTIHEGLKEYLKNTPKEKVIEDWNEFQHLDEKGITVKEFLENQKQTDEKGRCLTYWGGLEEKKKETLEEVGKNYIENIMKFSFNSLETKTQANRMLKCVEFGAQWQQERMYKEEEVHGIIKSYHNTIKNDPVNTTYGKWFEQFKKK